MATAALIPGDSVPAGISRRRRGKKWSYCDASGHAITDPVEIARLNAIGLPPAYRDCWFNPDPEADLQATGIDARGRKQYRYHPRFRLAQESRKYDRLRAFGLALPTLRQRVEAALSGRAISFERAVASVIRVLDSGALRVGNEQYRRANGTYGASTLQMRHLRVEGQRIRLRFTAKSGKRRELTLTDRSLLRFVRQMGDLPGQHLFQYLDDAGQPCPVDSTDINAFIRTEMGEDFTAKDFRTWAASVAVFEAITSSKKPPSVKEVADLAAARLDNTPAIARKSYIHPALLALTGDEQACLDLRGQRLPRSTRWLSREERGLLAFLDQAPAASELLLA